MSEYRNDPRVTPLVLTFLDQIDRVAKGGAGAHVTFDDEFCARLHADLIKIVPSKANDTEIVSSTWLRQLRTEYLQFSDEIVRLRRWIKWMELTRVLSKDTTARILEEREKAPP